jgi:hypothetical protein
MEKSAEIKATYAFPFPQESDGAKLVNLVYGLVGEQGIHGVRPKMGPHATVIPPFVCDEAALHGMACMSRALWRLAKPKITVEVKGLGFFPPPDPEAPEGVDALYIALEVDEAYREFVEAIKLGWKFPYAVPVAMSDPSDRVWVPHVSLLEAPGLKKAAEPYERHIGECLRGKLIGLPEPLFFWKKDNRWQKYLVS